MAYRLARGESIDESVRRVVREQIDKTLDEIDRPDLDSHETVHQVRKRCKKIRGVLRLVRPALPDDFKRENIWYRDAARLLSGIRDAQSVIEAFDDLHAHFSDAIDAEAFGTIRSALLERRERCMEDQTDLDERLEDFRQRIMAGRERIPGWQYSGTGFRPARDGLQKTYGRAREDLAAADRNPSTETIHEWRKRVKYHWYQLRLLRPIWPKPLKALCREADRLSDLLGDDHDLAVLRAVVLKDVSADADPKQIQALLGLTSQRQVELRLAAGTAGRRLFAEKPKAFSRRLADYYEAWRCEEKGETRTSFRPELVTR